AAPRRGPGRERGRTRPAQRRACDRRSARRRPARPLGLAGRDQRAFVRHRERHRREPHGEQVIQKPHVDWFALSPSLSMLGAAALLMMIAVFWPRRSRRDASAVTAAIGFLTAFVFAVLVAEKSPHATTIIADSVYRDRWAATAQLIVAACGLVG